jgi:short-subunit dehydrogenase
MHLGPYYAGKHAFITGGSEGIGFALAKHLANLGCKVSICSRSAAKLEAAKQEVLKDNAAAEINTFPMDVTHEGQVQNVFKLHIELWTP